MMMMEVPGVDDVVHDTWEEKERKTEAEMVG